MGYGGRGTYGRSRGGSSRSGSRRSSDYGDGGALFENRRKDSDSAPDFRGEIIIEGRSYWLAAWWNQGRSGDYLKIADPTPKDEDRRERYERGRDRGDGRANRRRRDGDGGGGYRSDDYEADADDGRGRFEGDPGPRSEEDYGARA